MSELMGIDPGRDGMPPKEQERRPRLTRRAWWAFAFLPVSFVVATLLGGWLTAVQGYDPDAEGSLPLRVIALAGIPASLVLLAPAIAGVLLGRSAMRHGEPTGRTPAIVGVVLIGLTLFQGILTLVAR